jgi:hypothetical protein
MAKLFQAQIKHYVLIFTDVHNSILNEGELPPQRKEFTVEPLYRQGQ